MKAANYRWQSLETQELPTYYPQLLEKFQLAPSFANYAFSLKLETEEDFRRFFQPTYEDLEDPFTLHDMAKSVERIQQAIENGEKILIYGDYDADGITSTTVLKEALETLGAEVMYYLPNRFKDGYGPNVKVYEEFIQFGIQLIITVDNGVAGNKAIAYAKAQGVDVIVTDHHELPEVLPDAFSIVHPRHPKGHYRFGQLAGVGVSFKLATALLGEIAPELLELVAIGTIADLVPLVGENRTLVQFGLQHLHYTDRPGLQALCQVAGCDLEKVTEEDIGFQIAPRLNALGRLEDASLGVELLGTFDPEEAKTFAEKIDATNLKRKELVQETVEKALQIEDETTPISFVAEKNWHEGILGIVAGRLVQEKNTPAFVMTINEETHMAKGSARGVASFDLYQAMSQVKELFTAFGGHQMAAGFSLPQENLPAFKSAMTEAFLKSSQEETREDLFVTFSLPVEELTLDFYRQMQQFAPFGNSHEKPHILLAQQSVTGVKTLSNGAHLKFQVGDLDVLAFHKGAQALELVPENKVSLVVDLGTNEWKGRVKVQLCLLDFEIAGLQVFDFRGQKNRLPQLKKETTYYLFSDLKNQKRLNLDNIQKITLAELGKVTVKDNLVLADCPKDLKALSQALEKSEVTRLFIWGYTYEEAYLNGLPNKQKFGRVFKFLAQQKNLDVRYKSQQAAQFLNLSEKAFIFIIQVFFELNFVTIEDGLLNIVAGAQNHDLGESPTYQAYERQMQAEEFLLYAPIQKIKAYFEAEEKN